MEGGGRLGGIVSRAEAGGQRMEGGRRDCMENGRWRTGLYGE